MRRSDLRASGSGHSARSGQALVMVTCSIFVIFGMLSLATDLGWAYFRREAAQTAADAASAAAVRAAIHTSASSMTCGSNGVWCGNPVGAATNCPATAPSSASTSFDNACMMASANGFTTSGSKTVIVQANTTSPPPNAPGVTANYWVTVTVSENQTGIFGAPKGTSALTSTAMATGAVTTSASGGVSSSCIYLLDKTMSGALSLSNGVTLATSSCGVYVNSNSATAVQVTGGAVLKTTTLNIVGNDSVGNGGSITGTVNHGASAIADPFSSMTTPTVAGTCSSGNFSAWQATPYTPAPGTYCGFTTGNGMSVVLSTGVYVINGGTFSIQGGSSVTATGGVLIYLTGGATVNIANGTSVTLSAQTSGSDEGVLFWQDKSDTSGATFAGGSNMKLTGSLYFPTANLSLNNGSNATTLGIVADSLSLSGGSSVTQATSQTQTGLKGPGGYAAQIVQ